MNNTKSLSYTPLKISTAYHIVIVQFSNTLIFEQ